MPLDILLAEDDALNAMALTSLLEQLGHRPVGSAENGREAIELARRHALDLAILDVRMPEVAGVEAAEEVFRLQPVPVIFLTGYSETQSLIDASDVPVCDHLVKPVSASELEPAIARIRARFREWRQQNGRTADTAS